MKLLKTKLIKTMLIIFFAGLLLCGVGAAITFAEVKSFTVIENDDMAYSKEETVYLPSGNEKIYYYNDIKVVKDETVPNDQIIVTVTGSRAITDIYAKIRNDKYLYDEGTGYISKHKVNYLDTIHFDTEDNEWEEFKQSVSALKERKIIVNNNNYDIVVKINPINYNRLTPTDSLLITYRDYIENYKEDFEIEQYN